MVWIGGGGWPRGGEEYNLHNDVTAAKLVFDSEVELWQIPRNIYSMLRVSLAELQLRVKPYAAIGHLFTQMIEFNEQYANHKSWPLGESWVLGDSAAIGVLLDEQTYDYTICSAPRIDNEMNYVHEERSRKIRVYHKIDARFILEDFYSKLTVFSQSH